MTIICQCTNGLRQSVLCHEAGRLGSLALLARHVPYLRARYPTRSNVSYATMKETVACLRATRLAPRALGALLLHHVLLLLYIEISKLSIKAKTKPIQP
ncbi:jg21376 [Pararge aegeria aegeria]|uniref:Jg21376 protein n=1 Tax=Pararge aegeria aegeria TaxID=348720 RepID=A0A8S4S0J6_9NEOP|nr:jg21376 [Pararge aegeria aegeria]